MTAPTPPHDGVVEPRVSDGELKSDCFHAGYAEGEKWRLGTQDRYALDLRDARTQLAAERTRADEAEQAENLAHIQREAAVAARTAAMAAFAEAEREIAVLREALEPVGRSPFATTLTGCFSHLTRQDARRAARLTAQAGETEGGAT